MADESSKIPEKTVEQIFDERYPLDKWEDSNYSILDKFSMRGRKGFVTGAAGGLGRNAAAALAQAGADVALVDLPSQEDKLTELAKDMSERFGTNVIALTCDVTNVEQVAELKTQLVEQLGTVDFAFLNAGVNVPGDDQDATEEVWTRTININPFLLVKSLAFLAASLALCAMTDFSTISLPMAGFCSRNTLSLSLTILSTAPLASELPSFCFVWPSN